MENTLFCIRYFLIKKLVCNHFFFCFWRILQKYTKLIIWNPIFGFKYAVYVFGGMARIAVYLTWSKTRGCSCRYSFTSSMDNCHLGSKTTRQLDLFQDLVPDRDSDVFARNELSQPGCQPSRNWDTGENFHQTYYNLV